MENMRNEGREKRGKDITNKTSEGKTKKIKEGKEKI